MWIVHAKMNRADGGICCESLENPTIFFDPKDFSKTSLPTQVEARTASRLFFC